MAASVTRRFVTCVVFGLLATLPVACSGDDQQAPQEPVAAEGAASPDAAAAAGEPGADVAKTDGKDPEKPAEVEKAPEAPKPEDTQTVGELTDQGGTPAPAPTDSMPDAAASPDTAATPPPSQEGPVESDALQGAFQDQQQKYENGPTGGPSGESAAQGGKKGKHKGAKAVGAGKTVRYVNATMLNVRAKPNQKAAVVRRLLGGAEVHVTIKGKWAMIKKGQWIRASYLSEQPTRKVSKHEADGAWRQAHHKAKAKKKGKSAHKKSAPAEAAPAESSDVTQPTGGQ